MRQTSSFMALFKVFLTSLFLMCSLPSHSIDFSLNSSAELTNADEGIYTFTWSSRGTSLDPEWDWSSLNSVLLSVYYEGAFVGDTIPNRSTQVDFQALEFGSYRFELKICGEFKYNSDSSGSTEESCSTRRYLFEFENDSPQEYSIENVPPQVSFVSGTDTTGYVGETINISVTASDNTESGIPNISNLVQRVDIFLTESSLSFSDSGTLLASITSSSGGYYKYDDKIDEPGQYYIVAVAYDGLGASSSAVQSVTIYDQPSDATQAPAAQESSAEFEHYQPYFGDFDGDNIQDLYFHGLPQIILIHGDIIIPIVLPAKEGFILFGKTDGSFEEVESWSMDDGSMAECLAETTCEKVSSDLLTFGDVDGDGSADVLVQNPDDSVNAVLISGSIGALPPQIILQVLPSGHISVKGDLVTDIPLFADNLAGSIISISGGKLIVDGQSFSIKQLTDKSSSVGSELAKDENINIAQVSTSLPQSTLTGSDVVKLDSLVGVGGEFRVNEMGAATYNIPLQLPQGIAGVTPSLGMSYSSQRQSGNMGLGWQFSSPGQITRCAQSLQIDKKAMPVNFSEHDRFCLDGQRLLLVTGSAYGAVGAVYKTEIDNGVEVKSWGGSLGFPSNFTATAKDGSTSYFGNGNNSQRNGYSISGTVLSNKIMSWHVNQFEDSVGNKISYHYGKTSEYHRLEQVRYAYSNSSSYSVRIIFDYVTGKYRRPTWISGAVFKDNSLLSGVRIQENGTLINSYKLTYNEGAYYSQDDNQDRLTNVNYCATEDYCSNPLSFTWGHPHGDTSDISSVVSYTGNFDDEPLSNSSFGGGTTVSGFDRGDDTYYISHTELDINGDGLLDFVSLVADYTVSYHDYFFHEYQHELDDGESQFVYKKQLLSVAGDPSARLGEETPVMHPIDINADGRSDLAIYIPATGKWAFYLATPNTTGGWYLQSLPSSSHYDSDMPDNVRFADLNSDGLVDLFYTENGKFVVRYLSKRDGVPSSNSSLYSYLDQPALEVNAANFDTFNFGGVVDFNQDGKVDVLATNIDVAKSGSACLYDLSFSLMKSNETGFSAMEVVPFREGSFEWLIPGTRRTASQYSAVRCTIEDMRRRIVGPFLTDINGDGLTDLVMAFSEPTHNDLWSSKDDSKTDPKYRFESIHYRLGNPDFSFGSEKTVDLGMEALGFRLMDMNFDDYQDLVITLEDNDQRFSLWDKSKSSFTVVSTSSFTTKNENYQTRFVDMNNDGLVDMVQLHTNTSFKSMNVRWGESRKNTVINQIENSLGQKTIIQHKPLNLSGSHIMLGGISGEQGAAVCSSYQHLSQEAYYEALASGTLDEYCLKWSNPTHTNATKFYSEINNPFANEESSLFADANVPAQELVSGMPVVTMVGSSAPTHSLPEGLALISYRYETLKVQAGGRGMLGFKSLMSTDLQTGVSTTTQYRQDWPFIGTPKRTVTTTSNGQVLSESTTTQAIVGVTDSNIASKRSQIAQSGTAALGPLVVYTKQNEEIIYDVPEGQLVMPGGVLSGSPTTDVLKRVVIGTTVDQWNNVLETTSSIYDGSSGSQTLVETKTTDNSYYSGGERLGRLSQSEVTTNRPGVGSITRTADFTYYGYAGAQCAGNSKLKGLLCSEKITVSDLDHSEAPDATRHFYDSYGNKAFQENGDRVSSLTVYDDGRYPSKTYDVFSTASGESSSSPGFNYSAPSGSVIVQTSEVLLRNNQGIPLLSRVYLGDKRSVLSSQKASPLGVVYFKGDSTGSFEETRRRRVQTSPDANCPANTATVQSVTKAGGSRASMCIDKTGREIGSYSYNLAGRIVRTETRYDSLGRAVAVSDPRIGTPADFTTTTYDILGRPKKTTHSRKITNVSGDETSKLVETSISYDGYAMTTTSSGISGGTNRVKREVKDALGQLSSVTEQNARSINYAYDVLGNLETVTDPFGNISTIKYNGLGQKTDMFDPDKGSWSYYYNNYGELVRQIDAKKQVTIIGYDFKGRKILSRTTAATNDPISQDIEQQSVYDSAKYGLGQIASESDVIQQHIQQYEYDELGRAEYTVTSMPNHLGDIERFYQRQTYDEYGRAYQTFDGARVGPQFSYNGIQNVYNSYGFLVEVRDAANDGQYFYKMRDSDARGNVTHMQYGDGSSLYYRYDARTGFLETIGRSGFTSNSLVFEAKWDHLGNLASRKDGLYGTKIETFKYDKHNRLTHNTLDGKTVVVGYNAIDNITSKSDQAGGATYNYHSTKVHAVEKIGTRELTYDANGNATEDGDKNLSYSVKDQVVEIDTLTHTTEFSYGVGGSRFKRTDNNDSGEQITTLYIGSVEKVYNADGSIQWKRSIGGKAQVLYTQAASGALGTGTRQYFLHDHLGSVAAITNANGDIIQRMAYDPWGARRKITSNQWQAASMDPLSGLTAFYKENKPDTNRGFTGHEMLDEVGIIHMNGRIYDATLGRFLQADPHIQEPTAVGSLNRYSYVMNNPLNATDPSGYFFKKLLKKIGGNELLSSLISIGLNFIPVCVGGWCSAVFAAATSYAVTGDLGTAFKSGIISFTSAQAFQGIGGESFGSSFGGGAHVARSIAHGLVGGVSSVLQGGKFGHGFASAGLTKFLNINKIVGIQENRQFARVALAAIVGGTISEQTGGKFANGAVTAAMGQMFNGERMAAAERLQKGSGGQMGRRQLYPDSGFDGHRQGMLTVGLLGFGVTAATCGATYGVGCVLGYLASTRMATEGATGTDVLAVAVTETSIAAGANPVDAATISDTVTLMFDIGTFAVGGVNLVKQPLFMFNKPGVIGPRPPFAPTASAAASTAIGPIDIIHDAMVVEGVTK